MTGKNFFNTLLLILFVNLTAFSSIFFPDTLTLAEDSIIYFEDSIPIGQRDGWVHKKVDAPATRYCDGDKCEGWIEDHYPNGQLKHRGYYKYGKLFKKTKNYYPNGQLESVGRVDANYRIGKWKYYYESGQQKALIYWLDGQERIFKTWYENGQLESDEKYNRNFFLKYANFYHETGELKSSYDQTDKKRFNCIEKEYHKNGNLKTEGEYVVKYIDREYRTMKVGTWKYYDDSGKLQKEEIYLNGKLKTTTNHEVND